MLRGLYYGNTRRMNSEFSSDAPVNLTGEIPKEIYFQEMGRRITLLLSSPHTQGRVCCLTEDPDVILGLSVFGPETVLHWLFVKAPWRKLGIAKLLLPETIQTCTALTKVGKIIKPKSWVYNPFLLEELWPIR